MCAHEIQSKSFSILRPSPNVIIFKSSDEPTQRKNHILSMWIAAEEQMNNNCNAKRCLSMWLITMAHFTFIHNKLGA